MPLPRNISIAIYPGKCVPTVGCAKTQESSCLKSSIRQLLMWTSGLIFSAEKTADYSLSSCMQHATYSGVKQLSGKTKTTWNRSALVEVSCCYQRTPLVYPILLKCNYSQTHRYTGIPMIFSKTQYLDKG